MDYINLLIDNYNLPILTAFLLGVLTSISPCPLATNITAVAYISKKIKSSRYTIFSGIFYTLGRATSYTILALLIYFGVSSFKVANIFQGWGDKILGPILIIIGLIMLGVIKFNFSVGGIKTEKIKIWLSEKGFLGSFLLGSLFALAFCPYSGVLFFGGLIPLILKSNGGLILPIVFAIGTGLPVIFFSFLIVFAAKKIDKTFKVIQKIEKIMRYGVAILFLGTGFYYLQHLINYLIN